MERLLEAEQMATDGWIDILEVPIDVNAVFAKLADVRCGAQLVFTGVVRNENQGEAVTGLNYEVFAPLARSVLADLVAEVRKLVGDPLRVVLLHRVGSLELGEISTVVAVATPHREESYKASRFLIEELKKRLPVWKEEIYSSGDRQWLDGNELGQN